MLRILIRIKVSSFLVPFMLIALPSVALSMNLPINKEMTVRLSTLSSQGQLQTVSDLGTKTDAQGKIAFNFSTVPSSTVSPYLHIQILYEASVLRQTIVPSPLPGSNVDIGVSETTDLQARSILKAVEISGKLSPLYLLVAQTLIRSPAISTSNAESIGIAVVAGAEAISNSLIAHGVTSDQIAVFVTALSKGQVAVAATYRKSVDDSVFFDQNIETYRRGEAFTVLLQSLINAGYEAGVNLETIGIAFASAGAATTETAIESLTGMSSIAKESIRLGYVTGILNLNNYKILKETATSLDHVGAAYPQFSRVFDTLGLLQANIVSNQKYIEKGILSSLAMNDINAVYSQEFNTLATQDLMLFKVALEMAFASSVSTEYSDLMFEITSRMASKGGIMSGMTSNILSGILGGIDNTTTSSLPLGPYALAVWSSIDKEPSFIYSPIAGLADQVISQPALPQFDKLAEPYKSLVLLTYDLSLISRIRKQEQTTIEEAYLANPANPQRWIPFSSVTQILSNDWQRASLVRQHISGASQQTKDSLIYLLTPYITTF